MKRCTKCLSKETVDTITFDESGVCSVCRQIEFKKEKSTGKREAYSCKK